MDPRAFDGVVEREVKKMLVEQDRPVNGDQVRPLWGVMQTVCGNPYRFP